jgi:hypothetical protein
MMRDTQKSAERRNMSNYFSLFFVFALFGFQAAVL